MARRDREPCLARKPFEQRLRERRSLDRVRPRGDLVEQDERPVRCTSRIETRLRTWPENVERLIAIDCSSPMSARTWSNTGSSTWSAGGRSPHWCSSAASPSVFSATVLPPVFGPEMTTARSSPGSRSIGTAVAGSSSGCLAPRRITPALRVTRVPRHRRERPAHARARSISPVASTRATMPSAWSPTVRESSRRIRVTSSRSALSASRSRLESSTTANGSTNSVCPEPELSWTMPGTAPRADARSARTGRPARSVTKSSERCSRSDGSRASERRRSVIRPRPSRSSRRRRRSAGEAPSRRSEPSSSTARVIGAETCESAVSTRRARSASPGASPAASIAARAAIAVSIEMATERSVAVSSALPRDATSAACRTSRTSANSGSADRSMRPIASPVNVWRRSTSSGWAAGSSVRQRSFPGSLPAVAARRSRIAGSSSSSRARGSIRPV